jgi:hypothetical protein
MFTQLSFLDFLQVQLAFGGAVIFNNEIKLEHEEITTTNLHSLYFEYLTCVDQNNKKPHRGEYETKEEYAERLRLSKFNCDDLKTIDNISYKEKVSLKYDVDNEIFTFDLFSTAKDSFDGQLHEITNWRDKSFKSIISRLYIQESKLFGVCDVPIGPDYYRGLPIFSKRKKGVGGRHFIYGDKRCNDMPLSFSKKYFGGAVAEITVWAQYEGVRKATGRPKEGRRRVVDYYQFHVKHTGCSVYEVKIIAKSPVEKARHLKVLEKNLQLAYKGTLIIIDDTYTYMHKQVNQTIDSEHKKAEGILIVKSVSLINAENDEVLFQIK